MPWDEPPSPNDAKDGLGMMVVVIVHPSCARGEGCDSDRRRGTGQVRRHLHGRPCLVVQPCLARVARWFLSTLNVYLSIKISTQLMELC
jgi:hypothetical protein